MSARLLAGLGAIGVGALSGALVGALVGGIGGRVVMRVSGFLTSSPPGALTTSNGNTLGAVTFEGTLGLVIFAGIAPGLFGGMLYAALRPVLTPFGRWRGAAFGLVLLAILGSAIFDPLNFDFFVFGPVTLNVAMFSALFLLFGVLVAWMYDVIERRSRDMGPLGELLRFAVTGSAVAGLAFLITIVVPTVGTLANPQTTSTSDMRVAVGAALGLLILAAGVIAATTRFATAAKVVVVLLVAFGAFRTIEGVARILS